MAAPKPPDRGDGGAGTSSRPPPLTLPPLKTGEPVFSVNPPEDTSRKQHFGKNADLTFTYDIPSPTPNPGPPTPGLQSTEFVVRSGGITDPNAPPGFFEGFEGSPPIESQGPPWEPSKVASPTRRPGPPKRPTGQSTETTTPATQPASGGQQGGIGQALTPTTQAAPRIVLVNEWRTRLLPASWRGVRFEIESYSTPVGRRAFVHEYPKRDSIFVEDSGKVSRMHQIQGYVLGDDYDIQRNALINALEEEGPGELVHPYLGVRQCRVGECKLTESSVEQRIAKFDMPFIDVEREIALIVVDDTAGKATTSAAKASALTNAAFAAKDAVLVGLAGAEIVLKGYLDFKTSVARGAALALGIVTDLGSDFLTSELSDYLSAQSDIWRLLQAATDVPKVPPLLRHDEEQGARALSTWVITGMYARCSEIILTTDYASRDDAVFDATSVIAGIRVAEADADPEAYDALATMRIDLATAIYDLGVNLPRLRDLHLTKTVPSFVLAYALYGTPYRAAEIVKRNKVGNPDFVSGDIRVLSR